LEATATRPDIEALQARLTLPDLRVSVGSYALAQSGTSEIAIANGVARVTQFALTGPSTDLRVDGTAGLTGTRPLDLRVDGNFDAAIASAFTDAVQARGATELRASITGTAEKPQAQGYLQMTNGQVGVRDPQVALDDLNVRVDLTGTRATISQLTGVLNGGDLSGGGSVDYTNGAIANANLSVKANDVYMNAPEGLKTMSNIEMDVRNVGEQVVVGGTVQIVEGAYTEEKITRAILARATQTKPLTSRNNAASWSRTFDSIYES
jgi:autotransporter translocation and assembly factor TamB